MAVKQSGAREAALSALAELTDGEYEEGLSAIADALSPYLLRDIAQVLAQASLVRQTAMTRAINAARRKKRKGSSRGSK